ncbi:RNA polymerase sigma factor [Stenotrophomonas sp. GZD-301]|uniref:RNA polymerase sigma factor n=1 Tax=Stenotrophomonas sp. GZD-301 TaxID=3404814 RepID=UPI003BB68B14
MPVIVAVRGSVLSAPSPLLRYVPEPLPRAEPFAAFVRDERAPLCAFLRARGASADDAEDIAQDCMERLIRYQSHGSEELRLLLYRIARNRLADRGRSPHARTHLPLAEGDGAVEPLCTAPGPLRQAESGQMLSLLRQALFKLPERCREVYLLNRISGMSYAQIARHRGITAKTVEKHIARALQGLRQELGPDTFGQDGDT